MNEFSEGEENINVTRHELRDCVALKQPASGNCRTFPLQEQ